MGAGVTYEGWKNYASWNVALWLNNEEPYYRAAVEFMQDYKGKAPYKTFMADCGLYAQRTPDKVKWVSQQLDYKALNEMMWELAPGGARKVQ